MWIGLKVAMLLCAGIALFFLVAFALKKFAPSSESLLPLVLSIIAITVATISAFKNEIFGFQPRVITGELVLAVPSEPSHRSFAIVYSLSFINKGYAEGIIEWVALKIHGDDGVRLYTPIAEVDFEKLLQGRRVLHSDNIRGAFSPFILGSKEASRHFVLFSQEEKHSKYPFKEWRPGKYRFELWVKSDRTSARAVERREIEITQEMIDQYFRGTGIVLMNYKIDVD